MSIIYLSIFSKFANRSRKLLPEEQVHHIDENPLNNDISNLMIVLRGEHQRQHSTGKHYKFSPEACAKRSELMKERWKNGVYDNRKIPERTEEHNKHLRESIIKYYKEKKERKENK